MVLLMSLGGFVSAQQFPSQIWHDGRITTTDGEVYRGKVKYDLDNNVVQLQGQTITTFSPSTVTYFEIFDEYYGGIRTFYSLPYAQSTDYEVPTFFELLTEGDNIALLCREYITTDTRGMGMYGPMYMNPMFGPPMMAGNKLAFDYYFFKDGRIQRYGQKKKELFEFMDDKSDEVNLFMRKNRLSHDKRGDLLRITAYYNQIK